MNFHVPLARMVARAELLAIVRDRSAGPLRDVFEVKGGSYQHPVVGQDVRLDGRPLNYIVIGDLHGDAGQSCVVTTLR